MKKIFILGVLAAVTVIPLTSTAYSGVVVEARPAVVADEKTMPVYTEARYYYGPRHYYRHHHRYYVDRHYYPRYYYYPYYHGGYYHYNYNYPYYRGPYVGPSVRFYYNY